MRETCDELINEMLQLTSLIVNHCINWKHSYKQILIAAIQHEVVLRHHSWSIIHCSVESFFITASDHPCRNFLHHKHTQLSLQYSDFRIAYSTFWNKTFPNYRFWILEERMRIYQRSVKTNRLLGHLRLLSCKWNGRECSSEWCGKRFLGHVQSIHTLVP